MPGNASDFFGRDKQEAGVPDTGRRDPPAAGESPR